MPTSATPKTSKPKAVAKKMAKTPELLRGFRDVTGHEVAYFEHIQEIARAMAKAYAFQRIELPILESLDVFERTVGGETDIVEKEMYGFTDPSGDKVALRPEATASVARAYINHGMLNQPQPVKMWYWGPMFRHDRPQAGRYRQFTQFGFETIGEDEPIVDAQLIVMATKIFEELGLPVTIQLNSIGTPENRKAYLAELANYFRPFRAKLCEDDKRRLLKNPLRLLDSKDPFTRELLNEAPQIVDWLDDDSKQHFMRVLEGLDELEIPYALNPHLVRGLDYYSRTVFEFWLTDDTGERAQNALGGGGRYDGLLELMGARERTPACGFALGVERLARAMHERKVNITKSPEPTIFYAQLGDAARRVGLRVFEDFRKAGVPLAEAFGKNALKSQLEMANKLEASLTLILGQKEVLDGTVIVRDMDSGSQEIVDIKKAVSVVQKKLAGRKENP